MKKKEDPVRVAIVGAGYWGANLIRNFLVTPHARISHICDANVERLLKYRELPGVICTTEVDEIFEDQSVDVVVIATPVSSHFALAKRALLAGKHVFVEKPMTKTSAEARELIRLADEKKKILHVDHTFIYYGPINAIKEIIDSGELGILHYFDSSRINLGLLQPDVNVFWDLAPHDISILNYFHEERPIRVSAVGTRHVGNGGVELAHITLQYASGFVAHIHTSWLSPVKMRQMTLGGSKKMIYFDDIHPFEKVKVYDKGIDLHKVKQNSFRPVYRNGEVRVPVFHGDEALLKECAHFVDAVRKGTSTMTDGRAGHDVVRVLEAAELSLKQEGIFIALIDVQEGKNLTLSSKRGSKKAGLKR